MLFYQTDFWNEAWEKIKTAKATIIGKRFIYLCCQQRFLIKRFLIIVAFAVLILFSGYIN